MSERETTEQKSKEAQKLPQMEIYYDPDTPENMERRAVRLKEDLGKLEKAKIVRQKDLQQVYGNS